jgi:hypothetical protein
MNIFAYKQGEKFSYDAECVGSMICKHALFESMPIQIDKVHCTYKQCSTCTNHDLIIEALGELIFQMKKEIRRLADSEERE